MVTSVEYFTSSLTLSEFYPLEWRKDLNNHFTKVAMAVDMPQTKVAYQIYYSFTTWSKDIILYVQW